LGGDLRPCPGPPRRSYRGRRFAGRLEDRLPSDRRSFR
jgi:hypothetical protein